MLLKMSEGVDVTLTLYRCSNSASSSNLGADLVKVCDRGVSSWATLVFPCTIRQEGLSPSI